MGADARASKRARGHSGAVLNGHDLDSLLSHVEAIVTKGQPDAQSLLQAQQRLQLLKVLVDKRLASCTVDSLTPHEAIEFIYRGRVRLVKVIKNDFDEDKDDDDDGDSDDVGPKPAQPDGSNRKTRPELVVQFAVGRDRLVFACRSEGQGPESRYSFELRLGASGRGDLLLRCASWDQAFTRVDWSAWEALRGRFEVDRRQVVDFTRGVVLHGIFAELNRRYAREESDSEAEAPGLVSTISICGMMSEAALPTSERQLAVQRVPADRAAGLPPMPPPAGAALPLAAAGAAAVLGRAASMAAESAAASKLAETAMDASD